MLVRLARNLMKRPPAASVPSAPPRVTFADISEYPDQDLLPPLDRPSVDLTTLSDDQRTWVRDGVLIKRKFLPDEVTAPYIAVRERLADISLPKYLGGWSSGSAYMHVPELRALSLHPPLMALYKHLIGEQMMLHLNLTNWVSSDRDWHQDDYLNPPFVNGWYIAVWIALDTIDPESGVFQYVPGSHRWPLMRGEKVRSFLPEEERTARNEFGAEIWPTLSQDYVAAAVEAEMQRTGAQPVSFLAERGDVLIWHARLLHRGSPAKVRFAERRSLIAHYSAIHHRPDMPVREHDENGMMYAVFPDPLV